jgi:hypothetical protein
MFVSNKDNTFHFNFDNIVSWRTRREENGANRVIYCRPIGETTEFRLREVSVEEFQAMFEEHKRLKNPTVTNRVSLTIPGAATWVTTAHSESGDDYGPCSITGSGERGRPTDDELRAFWRDMCPQEFEDEGDGPGDWGSFLFTTLTEV